MILAKNQFADLKFSDLNLYVELSTARSLRELCRRLSIQPSYLSKVIMKIEKKTQKKLVQRSSNGIVFTIEGMVLLKIIKKIISISNEIYLDSNLNQELRRSVGVAGTSYMHQYLMPKCLSTLSSQHANIQFRLLEIAPIDLVSLGIKGQFEIALHLGKLDWPKTWVTKKIGYAASALYGRANHPLGSVTQLAKLKKYRFVVPLQWTQNRISEGEDLCPTPVQQRLHGHGTMTATSALGLIAATDQVSFLPKLVAQDWLKKKRIMEIKVLEWPVVREPFFISAHGDSVSEKLFTGMIAELSGSLI